MGCGDVRPLRTGGVDFTGQERATLNKLTMPPHARWARRPGRGWGSRDWPCSLALRHLSCRLYTRCFFAMVRGCGSPPLQSSCTLISTRVLGQHYQVDEKHVDRPPRYCALARREPTMLGIKNGRQPQLDNTVTIRATTPSPAAGARVRRLVSQDAVEIRLVQHAPAARADRLRAASGIRSALL